MPHAVSLHQKACDLKDNHSCYLLCQSGVTADCSSTYGAFDEEMKAASDALTFGDLDSAASHLHAAAALQPTNPQPLFDEAVLTAYRVVPNLSTEANLALAQRAADTLHAVLKLRPDDGLALRVLATLYWNTEQFDHAEETLLHILKLAPADYEAEYILGYIDWRRAYPNVVQSLRTENLTYTDDNYASASAALCKSIATRNLPLLEDGTRHLRKALTLHPDDRNALMVLSLMDRLRAGTHCGDAAARAADLATANQLLVKVRALPASSRPTSPQPPSTLQPLSKTMIQVVTAPPAAPQPPPVAR
jgi:tetratricopeptide (TPR) repeat protein